MENKKRIAEAIATARQLVEKLEGELALSGETLKAQLLQLHAAYEADAHRVARQKEQLALWLAEEKAKIGGKQSNVEQP